MLELFRMSHFIQTSQISHPLNFTHESDLFMMLLANYSPEWAGSHSRLLKMTLYPFHYCSLQGFVSSIDSTPLTVSFRITPLLLLLLLPPTPFNVSSRPIVPLLPYCSSFVFAHVYCCAFKKATPLPSPLFNFSV